jgi:hypothetical protein
LASHTLYLPLVRLLFWGSTYGYLSEKLSIYRSKCHAKKSFFKKLHYHSVANIRFSKTDGDFIRLKERLKTILSIIAFLSIFNGEE